MSSNFQEECERVKKEISGVKEKSDMAFVLVTDSHLSDNTKQTCDNIRCLDEEVGFDCLVHMGDLLNGNNPERISRKNLVEAIELFRGSIHSKELYIARGNHDGYRDESYQGQLVNNIALDEKWYEDTCFMDENLNLSRVADNPFFYVDFPDKKIRFVVLCTNWYEHNITERIFKGYSGFTEEQLRWLGREALVAEDDDWNIMLFSHIAPLTELDGLRVNPNAGRNQMSDKGGREAVALVRACKESSRIFVNDETYDFTGRKTNILCWCVGHIHGDFLVERESISFIALASQTAYVPQLWKIPFGEFPTPRDLGSVTEDCWDSVVICSQERKVYFFRFGAGRNRVIFY